MAKKSPSIRTSKSKVNSALGLRPDFLWGVSTSAFQIEGAVREDGRGDCIWDTYSRRQGKVQNGDLADVACDHYHRYQDDIALMKGLGIDVYRFSVSWSRVIPRGQGQINAKGLDFYDRLIDAVLEAGIEPWLCLYHWDLPQALGDLGGWTNRDTPFRFADYTTLIARRYGDRVKHFATFNEQNVSILFGHAFSWNAPGVEDRIAYLKAAHHANLAHGLGVQALRDHMTDASVGIVHNCQAVHPESDTPENRRAADLLDAHWNLIYADPQILGCYPDLVAEDIDPYVQAGDMARICRKLDWFGLNHYGPIFAKADPEKTLGFAWGSSPASDPPHPEIGWTIYPQAFTDELLRLTKRYGLPIYVTENGCGSDREKPNRQGYVNDKHRIAYFKAYLKAMQTAVKKGADVRGYYLWSLLDCFEWASGFNNRFGIVRVDYNRKQKRTPKASYDWYRGLIAGEHKGG